MTHADTTLGQRPTTTALEALGAAVLGDCLRHRVAWDVELTADGGGDEPPAVFLQAFDLAGERAASG